ncbi:hypothetical protein GGF32_004332 [Allomyces javanicus]|nr:hypothetical protein GGF32_004332 [Allomyces javanicus]
MDSTLHQQQPLLRAAASRVHPYARAHAYARPHDGAWWPLALYQYWHAAASSSPGPSTAPSAGAWSRAASTHPTPEFGSPRAPHPICFAPCRAAPLPPPLLLPWVSSYYTIPAPSQAQQQPASAYARPTNDSQARPPAVPAAANGHQPAVPAVPAEPKRASRAEIQAATDAAIRFLEHELVLTSLAKHLRRSAAPPADMDLALREYRRFLILKVVHRDERATLLSPGAQIDAVWHAHVLNTQAYMAMNDALPLFLHHDPNGAYDEDPGNRARRFENTRACYRARWGDLPATMWDDVVAPAARRGTRAPSPAPVQHLAVAGHDGKMEVVLVSDATKPEYRVRVTESTRVEVVAAAFAARFSMDMPKLRLNDGGERLDLTLTFAECGLHADEGPHTIDVAYEQVGSSPIYNKDDVFVMDPNQQQQQPQPPSRVAAADRPADPAVHHHAPALPQESSRAAASRGLGSAGAAPGLFWAVLHVPSTAAVVVLAVFCERSVIASQQQPAPENTRPSMAVADPTTVPRTEVQMTTDAAIQFLEHDLDLTTLAAHLRRSSEPPADMDLALREYRRFLILKVVHGDERATLLSPGPQIDAIWHAHVLDTRGYKTMNEQLPFWIHHDPSGAYDEDAGNRARRLENTRACYRARWGALPAAMWDDVARPSTRGSSPAQTTDPTAADKKRGMEPGQEVLVIVRESSWVEKAAALFAVRFNKRLSRMVLYDEAMDRIDMAWTFADARLRRSAALAVDLDLALREYRRFLVLKVAHQDANAQLLSPSAIVDQVWHAHLLDTMAYLAMNDHLPFFIHHDPRGAYDEDAANRVRRFDNTRTTYRARWGVDPPGAIWDDVPAMARAHVGRRPSTTQVPANSQGVVKVTLLLPNKRDKVLFLVKETTRVAKVVTHFAHRIHARLATLRFYSDEHKPLDTTWTFAECGYCANFGVRAVLVDYSRARYD